MPDFVHDGFQDSGVLIFEELSPELQSCAGILDTVMAHIGVLLNFFFENYPCQETKGEFPATSGAEREEFLRVDDLGIWDVDIDDSEVARETVADEGAAKIEENPKFLVDFFEADELEAALAGCQVAFVEPGVLGEIVINWLFDGDVVVYEWQLLVHAVSSEDGDSSQARTCRSCHGTRSISTDVDLFSQKSYKFSVDANMPIAIGQWLIWRKGSEVGKPWLRWASIENARIDCILPAIVNVMRHGLDLICYD